MLGRSRRALAEKKPALRSNRLTTSTRISLHSCYVRGHLLQNVSVVQPFTKAEFTKLNAEYMRGLRVCVDGVIRHVQQDKVSNEELLRRHGLLPLEFLMEKRSVSLFPKLAISDNTYVRAPMSACFSKLTCWPRMFSALQRFQEVNSAVLGHLPRASSTTLTSWVEFAITRSGEWDTMAKAYRGVTHGHAEDGSSQGAGAVEVGRLMGADARQG
eukprot:3266807-Amphidinium_carterae.1